MFILDKTNYSVTYNFDTLKVKPCISYYLERKIDFKVRVILNGNVVLECIKTNIRISILMTTLKIY